MGRRLFQQERPPRACAPFLSPLTLSSHTPRSLLTVDSGADGGDAGGAPGAAGAAALIFFCWCERERQTGRGCEAEGGCVGRPVEASSRRRRAPGGCARVCVFLGAWPPPSLCVPVFSLLATAATVRPVSHGSLAGTQPILAPPPSPPSLNSARAAPHTLPAPPTRARMPRPRVAALATLAALALLVGTGGA